MDKKIVFLMMFVIALGISNTLVYAIEGDIVTTIDYFCNGDNSIRNETIITGNITSNTTSQNIEQITCDYGCNDDNPIITIWGNEASLCNPPEYFQFIVLILILIGIYALYRRLK